VHRVGVWVIITWHFAWNHARSSPAVTIAVSHPPLLYSACRLHGGLAGVRAPLMPRRWVPEIGSAEKLPVEPAENEEPVIYIRATDMIIDYNGDGIIVLAIKHTPVNITNTMVWTMQELPLATTGSRSESVKDLVRAHCTRLPFTMHGHAAVLNCGSRLVPTATGAARRVRLQGKDDHHSVTFNRLHVCRHPLDGVSFTLMATVMVDGATLDHPLNPLGAWLDHHYTLGIQHVLVYVDDLRAANVSDMLLVTHRYNHYVNRATFLPFWLGSHPDDPYHHQQMQEAHALYSLRGR
jgi:hypothetical protein